MHYYYYYIALSDIANISLPYDALCFFVCKLFILFYFFSSQGLK